MIDSSQTGLLVYFYSTGACSQSVTVWLNNKKKKNLWPDLIGTVFTSIMCKQKSVCIFFLCTQLWHCCLAEIVNYKTFWTGLEILWQIRQFTYSMCILCVYLGGVRV